MANMLFHMPGVLARFMSQHMPWEWYTSRVEDVIDEDELDSGGNGGGGAGSEEPHHADGRPRSSGAQPLDVADSDTEDEFEDDAADENREPIAARVRSPVASGSDCTRRTSATHHLHLGRV
jgi:hypothetical protein